MAAFEPINDNQIFTQFPNHRKLGAFRQEGEPVALRLLDHNCFKSRWIQQAGWDQGCAKSHQSRTPGAHRRWGAGIHRCGAWLVCIVDSTAYQRLSVWGCFLPASRIFAAWVCRSPNFRGTSISQAVDWWSNFGSRLHQSIFDLDYPSKIRDFSFNWRSRAIPRAVNPRRDDMSPVGASMYCSPHPAALHIAPTVRLQGFCL